MNDATLNSLIGDEESRLRHIAMLFHSIGDAVIGTDVEENNFKINIWNRGAEKIYGWKSHEVIGKAAREVLQTKFKSEEHRQQWMDSLNKNGYWSGEVQQTTKDGNMVDILASTAIVKDSEGRVIGAVAVNRDISEYKNAQKALQQSEELFRQFSNNITNLAWIADGEGWIFWYNQRWYDYTGTTFEEMQGWGWEKVHHPDHVERVVAFVKDAWKEDKEFELTFPLRRHDGEYHWFLTRAVPVKNEEGKIHRWIGTNTDVHDQVEVQALLKQTKDQLELTLTHVPAALFLLDKTGKILFANDNAAYLMNYPSAKMLMNETDHARLRDRANDLFELRTENGEIFHVEEMPGTMALKTGVESDAVINTLNKKTGESRWILSRATPLHDPAGEVSMVLLSSADITVQKTAEEKIRRSESRYRNIFETVPVAIWEEDMSETHAEMVKLKEQHQQGIKDFLLNNPAEIWRIVSLVKVRNVNQAALKIFDAEKKDDLLKGLDVIFTDETLPAFVDQMIALVNGDKNFESEYLLQTASGRKIYTLVSINLPRGSDYSSVLVSRYDITERKRAEEFLEKIVQQRTKELQRSNEDLQQFAHVASHDLKEPVRKITTFISRLSGEFENDLPEKAKMYIQKVQSAALRMGSMIDGVLHYSTVSAVDQKPEVVDLNEVLSHIEADLELFIQQKKAAIRFADLPRIKGSPVLIHQLFYNLTYNSLKFSRVEEPPVITISSFKRTIPNGTGSVANYTEILFSDNGIGFDQELAESIFKPFTRLNAKDKFDGTGLGLSLCKKIVERHGGFISAEGKEGTGATFRILWPA